MITNQLLNPKSIAVIGGSNDITKPGGRLVKNLLDGNSPTLYVVNPKETEIQGIKCHNTVEDLPNVDLAFLCIAAKFAEQTIETLCSQKNTKAIIIVSAGFSEVGEEGKILEDKIVAICNKYNASLIGPNCIGMLTPAYSGVFIGPIPKLESSGCDFVSGSGATAVYILKESLTLGLNFNTIYSVGNSAQIGVEDVIEYWDKTFDAQKSPRVKLLYMENVKDPQRLLKHCRSLISKGCHIAGIKSGTTEAGSRAATSHTGALADSDTAVDALFKKAGIIRCYGRIELITVATILQQLHCHTAPSNCHTALDAVSPETIQRSPEETPHQVRGDSGAIKNIAIVTHAGGPAVMTTDTLIKSGMNVPHIEGKYADELAAKLYHGSSVANPIDFLATGTAEQLADILDYIENHFDNIDATAVIYGSPYLFDVSDIYKMVDAKKKVCKKPIFSILPSSYHTEPETELLFSLGRTAFDDEVAFAQALGKVCNHKLPVVARHCEDLSEAIHKNKIDCHANARNGSKENIDTVKIRNIIENASNGYLEPQKVQELLDAAGIHRAAEAVITYPNDVSKLRAKAREIGYPLVMKVVGPVHKSDVGGVKLNINDEQTVIDTFAQMMRIKGADGVLLQPMLSGTELFVGAKAEEGYGHLILCGLGGIFIEVLKDVQYALCPISHSEALDMIKSLKSYQIIEGVRGQAGINQDLFADIIVRLSALLTVAPEIFELDLNPLLGTADTVIAVDARINISRT